MMTSIPTKERRAGILKVDTQRWTYEDLKDLPESFDRYEIIDGVLYMSPSPHVSRHQRTLRNLFRLLDEWVAAHQLGEVFLSPSDVVVAEDKVFQPDLFFLTNEKRGTVDAFVSSVPDLIVEVVSPSSQKYDREIKFRAYEEVEVKEYWIVDPEDASIELFIHDGSRFRLHDRFTGDETASSVLLNGLRFPVTRLFEK